MKEFKNYNSSNDNNLLFILPINTIDETALNEICYSLSEQGESIDLLVLVNGNLSIPTLDEILKSPSVKRVEKDQEKEEPVVLNGTNKINYIINITDQDSFGKVFNEGFNYAIANNYKWFVFCEHDDIFSKNWLKYFKMFSETNTEYDGFLPLTKETAPIGFSGFMNEACWVDGMAEVAGVFDLNLLLKFNCMNITGTALKTESVKQYSEEIEGYYKPIKESIKINYLYEFFLRMIYNDLKLYTIPRIGYDHRINKSAEKLDYFNSKMPSNFGQIPVEKGGITQEEYKFWMELSKKEYFFDNDRSKIYQAS